MTLNGAIMQLVELREDSMMPEMFKPCFDKVIETISECEEPRKGEWVNDEHDMPRCSCCGYMPEYDRHIDDYYYSDWCPNCGARMEVDEE